MQPLARLKGLRGLLKGGTVFPAERDATVVIRSLPHGHVAATVGIARKIGIEGILGHDGNRRRDLAGMVQTLTNGLNQLTRQNCDERMSLGVLFGVVKHRPQAEAEFRNITSTSVKVI